MQLKTWYYAYYITKIKISTEYWVGVGVKIFQKNFEREKDVLRLNCILEDSQNIITVIKIWKVNSTYKYWMYERSKILFNMLVRISDERKLNGRPSYKWEFNIKIYSRVFVCLCLCVYVCVCARARARARTNWSCSGCCPVTDLVTTMKFCFP
jgi:hypothetical protein